MQGNKNLNFWRGVMVSTVRSNKPDLTARQVALLLTIYLQEGPHTVKGLACVLNISKPAVSRGLDRLCILGFAAHVRDEADKRNVFAVKTEAGANYLQYFSSLIEEMKQHGKS